MKFIKLFFFLILVACEQNSPRIVEKCTVNLDEPADKRWQSCLKNHEKSLKNFSEAVDKKFGRAREQIEHFLSPIENNLDKFLPKEMANEIRGVAAALGQSVKSMLFFNLMLEAMAGCTAVAVQDKDGSQYLARNLDFGPTELGDLLIDVSFTRNDKPVFQTITFAGYVGVLTGMSSKLAVALNQRYLDASPQLLGNSLDKTMQVILNSQQSGLPIATLSWELRQALQNNLDFETFKKQIRIVPLYLSTAYIVAVGTNASEGMVYARDREAANSKLSVLGEKKGVFALYQTNFESCLQCERCTSIKSRISQDGTQTLVADDLLKSMMKEPVLVKRSDWMTFHSTVMNPKKSLMINQFHK